MTLDIDNYNIESWTVVKGIQDAIWILSGQIDKHNVPAFFEKIKATARDQNNIPHTVFAGIIPGMDYTLAVAANKALLTGYDYAWYLTVQYVPAGDRITDIDTNPSETIEALLGGTSWATVTGIEPHRINTVADWANIKKVFEFGEKCTRWKAIQEVCEHCHFVFVVKWNDSLVPQAYFVHEDDIDSDTAGIDLPTMITITNPDAYLMDGIPITDSPEHQYNRVKATGYDASTQTNLSATAETAEVTAGTELAIEYAYGDTSLDTQAKTEARAQELLDFFQSSAKVYTARFKQRMDLELYQKIEFSGYQKIEQEEMRITRISYSRAAYDDTVEIEFSRDQAVQQLKRLSRAVNPDYVSGQQELIEDDLSDIGLTDVFNAPSGDSDLVAGLWEVDGVYTQLMDANSIINAGGWLIDNCTGLRGPDNQNVSLWGWDSSIGTQIEYLKWMTATNKIQLAGNLTMGYETTLDMNSGRIDNLSRIDPRALGVDVYDYYGNLSVTIASMASGLILHDRIDMYGNDIVNVGKIKPDVVDFNSITAPAAATGAMYFSSADNKLHYYNGTQWMTIQSYV